MVSPRAQVVVAAASNIVIDKALIRAVRGKSGNFVDRRFMVLAILSIAFHAGFLFYVQKYRLAAPKTVVIEEVPERFARLIIEKPLPKTEALKTKPETGPGPGEAEAAKKNIKNVEAPPSPAGSSFTPAQRTQAQRNVNARVARVEEKSEPSASSACSPAWGRPPEDRRWSMCSAHSRSAVRAVSILKPRSIK